MCYFLISRTTQKVNSWGNILKQNRPLGQDNTPDRNRRQTRAMDTSTQMIPMNFRIKKRENPKKIASTSFVKLFLPNFVRPTRPVQRSEILTLPRNPLQRRNNTRNNINKIGKLKKSNQPVPSTNNLRTYLYDPKTVISTIPRGTKLRDNRFRNPTRSLLLAT